MNWRDKLTKPKFGDKVVVKTKLGRSTYKETLYFVDTIDELYPSGCSGYEGAEIFLTSFKPISKANGGNFYKYSDIKEIIRGD